MRDRLERLLELFAAIEGRTVSEDYTVRGTSLKKLAETAGPGYYRVLSWAEQKQPSRPVVEEVPTVNPDMIALKAVHKHCWEVMNGRSQKYGDSWRVLSIQSLANLIEMKMNRIANMSTDALEPKIVDEFVDASNYATMALQRLQEQGITYKHD